MEWWMGVILITMAFIALSALTFVLIDSFKRWIKIKYHRVKSYFKATFEKIIFMKRIWHAVFHTYTSHAIEMLFQSYAYFYEKNYDDLQGWEYLEGVYSKNDLMNVYKWIKQTRPKNFEEFNKINYDSDKKCFEYWGSHYQFLKFRIDDEGELKIYPVEFVEAEHPDVVFQKMMMKLQNELYLLDTKQASWILERRKYFYI